MDGWFYMRGEDQVGPVSEATIIDLASKGELPPTAMVLHPSKTVNRWISLDRVPLLNELALDSAPVQATAIDEPLVVVEAAPAFQFKCPFCGATASPITRTRVSTAGTVIFVVLLLFMCLPLCWIGLLLTTDEKFCTQCGMKLG